MAIVVTAVSPPGMYYSIVFSRLHPFVPDFICGSLGPRKSAPKTESR